MCHVCGSEWGQDTQEKPAGVLVVCGVREGESRDKLGSLVGTDTHRRREL